MRAVLAITCWAPRQPTRSKRNAPSNPGDPPALRVAARRRRNGWVEGTLHSWLVFTLGVLFVAALCHGLTPGYVAVSVSRTVTVVDIATNVVGPRIPVGGDDGRLPGDVAVSPDGSFAYVVSLPYFVGLGASSLSVIDTATNRVAATIPVSSGDPTSRIAFAPDGAAAYVTNPTARSISVINTSAHSVSDH